ncbi:MAG: rRNA maturation RNase YbeY [Ignavibacteria bacterium]
MKINFIFKSLIVKSGFKKVLFRKKVRHIAARIVSGENTNFGNINLVFCDDKFIRDYNNKYLGHDYETDILTFPDINDEGKTEGEMLISVETVNSNSMKFKTNYDEEICRVIIHGFLHLCGYKDKTTSEKIKMRKKENFYIKQSEDAR